MALWLTSALIAHIPKWIPLLFILIDLLAGCFLYKTAQSVTKMLLQKQNREAKNYAKDTEEFLISTPSLATVPQFVLIAYLFNPYSIMNCVGQTMTVWSNFLLAGFLLGMSHRQLILSIMFLAVEVQQNMYPLVLIVPLIINHATTMQDNRKSDITSKKSRDDDLKEASFNWTRAFAATGIIAVVLGAVAYLNFIINHQQWNFIDSTFGFM